jgi:hypothetical protein
VAYVRTVKTASGARAVQIVHSSRQGSLDIEHIGSAHDEAQLAALRSVARQRLTAGQDELDLGLDDSPAAGGPLAITGTRTKHLWDALCRGFDVLGFGEATGGDEVFRQLVLARIIEPTSKLDSLRVLGEAGIETVSYPTLNRRLPVYATDDWRQALAAACAAHAKLGPASLVLYDVSTLYFEIVARALARSAALELVNNHLDWLSLAPTTAVLRCSPPSTDSRRGIPSGAVDCGSPAGGTGSCAPHQHADDSASVGRHVLMERLIRPDLWIRRVRQFLTRFVRRSFSAMAMLLTIICVRV